MAVSQTQEAAAQTKATAQRTTVSPGMSSLLVNEKRTPDTHCVATWCSWAGTLWIEDGGRVSARGSYSRGCWAGAPSGAWAPGQDSVPAEHAGPLSSTSSRRPHHPRPRDSTLRTGRPDDRPGRLWVGLGLSGKGPSASCPGQHLPGLE